MKFFRYFLLAATMSLFFIACPTTVKPTLDPRVETLTLSGPTRVEIAQTVQLTTSIDVVDGASSNVSYISSDTRIATVNSNGMVTGVSNGGVTITVRADFDTNVTASHSLTVPPPSVSSLSLTGPTTVEIAQIVQLSNSIVTVSGASSNVSYISSDNRIATVNSSGMVTGVSNGGVTITVRADFDTNVTATHRITVPAPSVSSLSLTGPATIEFRQPTQLTTTTVTVSGASSAVRYTSSDTNRVTVDSNGVVTGLIRSEDNPVTITAISVFDSTKMATHTIRVVPAQIGELSYGATNFVFALGIPITPLRPTLATVGVLGTININIQSATPDGRLGKALPVGLTLHNRTGEISGTPSNVVASESYSIFANGEGDVAGALRTIITISVTNTNN